MAARTKPGSKADRDALRTELLTAGVTRTVIVAEMRTRWAMRPREAWRHAHGWSLQEAADRVNAADASRTVVSLDASLLGKLEKWPAPASRRPSLPVLALLAEVYGCAVDDLLDLDDLRQLPDADLRVLRQTAGPGPTARTEAAPAAPAAALASDSTLVLAAAEESATWAQWAENSNIGDIALEQLFADIRAISMRYLTEEPMPLFQRARELRDHTFRLLEGHQPPRQTSDLYVAAGYLCALLAWFASDLGQLQAADTQGRTAWLCAELSGHDGLRAWVSSTRSKIAFWDRRYRDAVNHARRGASYAVPGTALTLLACQEADAWAELGAHDDAQGALLRADQYRDQQAGADEIGGLLSCSAFRMANYVSGVHLRTGQPALALAEAEAALAPAPHEPVRAYGTVAQMQLSRAAAHAAIGSADGVLESVLPVLSLAPEQRLDTVARRLQDLARTVARTGMAASGVGRELQGAIEVYVRDSAPRIALSPTGLSPAWITGHE